MADDGLIIRQSILHSNTDIGNGNIQQHPVVQTSAEVYDRVEVRGENYSDLETGNDRENSVEASLSEVELQDVTTHNLPPQPPYPPPLPPRPPLPSIPSLPSPMLLPRCPPLPPPVQTNYLASHYAPVEASGDAMGEQRANREMEFNYRPLPPLPDELVNPPPKYSLIAQDITGGSTPLNRQGASNASYSGLPFISLYDVDGSDGQQRCRSFHIREPGVMGFSDSISRSTERAAKSRAMVMSLVAFLCVPVLGWIPLMLSCVMFNCNDGMSSTEKKRLSKFITSFSIICLVVGVTLAIVYAPRLSHFYKH